MIAKRFKILMWLLIGGVILVCSIWAIAFVVFGDIERGGGKPDDRPRPRPLRERTQHGAARDDVSGMARDSPYSRPEMKVDAASDDWRAVVAEATAVLKGDDLHSFLQSYGEEHGRKADFDRVGFVNEMMNLFGPGSRLASILSAMYSQPIDIPADKLLDEICGYELAPLEREMFFSAAISSPALHTLDLEDGVKRLEATEDTPLKGLLRALIQQQLASQLKNSDMDTVIRTLGEKGPEWGIDVDQVTEAAVGSNPNDWLVTLGDLSDTKPERTGFVEAHGNAIVNGLGRQMPLDRLVEAIIVKGKPEHLPASVSRSLGALWVGQDANAVAKWALSAPDGEFRDCVVAELVKRLELTGLKDDASGWKKTIRDPKLLD